MTNQQIDLLIIGAGPVGLTAAIEAHRLGLSTRLIERKEQRSTGQSRALVVHPRVLELLEPHASVVSNIQQKAFENQKVNVHFNANENVMEASTADTKWGDTNYPFIEFLPQYDTERILEEQLELLGGKVEYGVSLEGLTESDSKVHAQLLHGRSNKVEDVTATFVVGCDGGRSKTRELMGIDMKRSRSQVYFIVADVSFKKSPFSSTNKELHLFPHPQGIGVFFPLPQENTFRLMFQTPPGMTNKTNNVQLDKIFMESLLLERTGLDFEINVCEWQTIFEITHGCSDTFRKGRVFLAGDASHVHSPVGGQGMNYGIQDAVNLLWKLAWAKRCMEQFPGDKLAVDAILETYNQERQSAGNSLIANVDFATQMVTSRNRWLQMVRNLVLSLVLPIMRKDFFRKVGQLELQYEPSWSDIIFPAPSYWETFICKPGQRLPNLLLADGSKLHSKVDRARHTLLFLNTTAGVTETASLGDCEKVQATIGTSQVQTSAPVISERVLGKPQVILVRPDLYVAAVDTTFEKLSHRVQTSLDEATLSTM